MLNDADVSRFRHVYVFVGKTDLRKGISGLSTLVKEKFHLNPFDPGNLFLFADRAIKRSRESHGRETDSFSFTKDLRQALFDGRAQRRKHAVSLRNSSVC